jgi:hypothetical protein
MLLEAERDFVPTLFAHGAHDVQFSSSRDAATQRQGCSPRS